ncbi:5-formyltetrahydrofolate cyclo-ligase [Chlamydia sp.]|uniref:5-formyltetrahydrofolate cyclo-ligase n=1 Tax=Chlamydia sp. TaxID=35827 RepID=UPI0025BD92AF|nr:5-formyltetrahydrofolate cyclo-ligase [Chlamydia sp.]MBQ8498856.1 5-formyltetrahydrofolate cyclo-ligase [Chlamydia sp.]
MKTIVEQKFCLRREGLARREQIPPFRRKEAARHLWDFVVHHIPKGLVLSYVPFRAELDVHAINIWLAQQKRVLFPKIQGLDLIPVAFSFAETQRLSSPKDLDAVKGEAVDARCITAALVPAVVFDQNKFRLGYGGGYYDRFLMRYPYIWTVGVGFKEQQIVHLPREEHDIPLNMLYLT